MTGHSRSHSGQILDEMNQAPVLYVGLGPGVLLMVDVLPSTGAVHAGSLELALWRRVNYDVGPRWRNPQSLDSG